MSGIDPAIGGYLAAQDSAVKTQISYAVAGKQLDAARQQGDAAVQLLEDAVQLSRAIGKGAGLDATA
jgi:hypothetical protein